MPPEHLPAILENKDVVLKAIYSRSRVSAEKLAQKVGEGIEIYYDSPQTKDKNLDSLLARKDITAVVACLPILVQLDIVKKCLLAGKHVQSEKPIAGDVATASDFIQWFRTVQKDGTIDKSLIWGVAEEFRLMPSFDYMREEVAKLGNVQTFYAQGYGLTKEGSEFYETAWRKVPGYQGGFLVDGGVHWTAGLLHMLGVKNRPVRVTAFSNLLHKHLAPVDTVNAVVQLDSGASGVFAYSAGIEHKAGPGMYFEVVCEGGRVTFVYGEAGVVKVVKGGEKEIVKEFESKLNSRYEIGMFVKSIMQGSEEVEETPERALDDLEFMQRMLESGREGGVVKELRYSS
jgi:predicted dehydrogenase